VRQWSGAWTLRQPPFENSYDAAQFLNLCAEVSLALPQLLEFGLFVHTWTQSRNYLN
jgi:hypothetical protein